MKKFVQALAILLLALTALATRPATAATCSALVTCYSNLPKHSYPQSTWQYSHQCCDLQNHTTVWNVYIDRLGKWHLVSSNIGA